MNTQQIMDLAHELAGVSTPLSDSAIYVPAENVRKALFGIDLGPAELLIAKQLGYDLAISHHPLDTLLDAWRVYGRHVDIMVANGVPQDVAQAAVADRMEMMRVRSQAANYDHVPSVAKLLSQPYMNIHGPCDEMGRQRLQAAIDGILATDPGISLGRLAEHLAGAIPEFALAKTTVQPVVGDPDSPAGRVVVAHGAYTNGGYKVAKAYYDHGIQTVVYIHVLPDDLVRLRQEARGNLLVTGHTVSDAIGINPLIDALQDRGIEVTAFSGIVRP